MRLSWSAFGRRNLSGPGFLAGDLAEKMYLLTLLAVLYFTVFARNLFCLQITFILDLTRHQIFELVGYPIF